MIIDYAVADTTYFFPKEVSRNHAKIVRTISDSEIEFKLIDIGSTCGTYVNNNRIDPNDDGVALSHGDTISLGPSLISTYLFYAVSD